MAYKESLAYSKDLIKGTQIGVLKKKLNIEEIPTVTGVKWGQILSL